MKEILFVLLLLLPAIVNAANGAILIDDYQHGLAKGWKEKKFKGQTHYTVVEKDGRFCVEAVSKASASGLFYEIDVDTDIMPILTWQWQIEDVLDKGDATKKSGDDYAARVYVVFPSSFFWRTRALNYIWDNRLPKETVIVNAYTKNAMMIVVESGAGQKGKWVTEERNIREDYLLAFGEPPPAVGAIAIMTDTDDTGESARAWYGPIWIKRATR
ncbi:MAG: DUF3047 domain-containing protein [Desulfobulbaceae bacterium]|nr:DUF3047 domain-containing protein [Desulfobulbaceae bacterium]